MKPVKQKDSKYGDYCHASIPPNTWAKLADLIPDHENAVIITSTSDFAVQCVTHGEDPSLKKECVLNKLDMKLLCSVDRNEVWFNTIDSAEAGSILVGYDRYAEHRTQ